MSAGAILTTTFLPGTAYPLRCMAVVTLNMDSLTALSGSPTRKIPTPGVIETSTVIFTASIPAHVALYVLYKLPPSLIIHSFTVR